MFTEQAVFFFYTETPLHAGSGSSVAYVDLPIQREKHTEYPIVQASGVKGAFRSRVEELSKGDEDKAKNKMVFGPKTDADEHSGALSFGDAQVLLFPVRSFAGGFAWITCPLILNRLHRTLKTAGLEAPDLKAMNDTADMEALVNQNSHLMVNRGAQEERVLLEDFSFLAKKNGVVQSIAAWIIEHALPADASFDYIKTQLPARLAVLPDDRFRDFVVLSTDVQTRISIDEKTGTVDQGPWNEELLLTDTLLYSLALAKSVQDGKNNKLPAADAIKFVKEKIIDQSGLLQMGGDETLGRGLVRVRYLDSKTVSGGTP